MLAKKGYILVQVDTSQKVEAVIGDSKVFTGKRYNVNFREKNPVLATVIDGYGGFKKGATIVCNYNYFDDDSQFLVSDGIFCIPVDEEIYAIIDEEGEWHPVCKNLLVGRVPIEHIIDIPEELRKNQHDRGMVIRGNGKYKAGDFIFWLPYSDLEMIYLWEGVEKRAIRVSNEEVCGVFVK
jgi:hypothetical protein